jgi:hypothetical protein
MANSYNFNGLGMSLPRFRGVVKAKDILVLAPCDFRSSNGRKWEWMNSREKKSLGDRDVFRACYRGSLN